MTTEEINQIFEQRSATHGMFEDNARLTMNLRTLFHHAPNWKHLTGSQQLALDEIALKIARLLSTGSAAGFSEHWTDIAGYAKLGGGVRHATKGTSNGV